MPHDNIKGDHEGVPETSRVSYEEYLYEGYGQRSSGHGRSDDDNKNRTVPEIRPYHVKERGKPRESGCVSWILRRRAISWSAR